MTTRTLKDGSQVLELENPKTLTVYTRCPEKYRLIDMETGEQYVGLSEDGPSSWEKVEPCQI